MTWINIDKLGSKGMEPDLMPPHRDPQSLDVAMNVRALGPNLANAGGYRVVPNATLPDEVIPTNCACPDQHYELSLGDGDTHVDRSWTWDWGAGIPQQAIFAFQVLNAVDADQRIILQEGECEAYRQGRIELQVFNTAASRRIKIEVYNTSGVLADTPLDYDASTEFTDGSDHWVFIERHAVTGDIAFRVVLDSTSLYDNSIAGINLTTDYVTYRRENSASSLYLPVPIWNYSQSVWDCLTAGAYTGLGGCLRTGPQVPIVFDTVRTDADLALYRGDAVAAPVAGTPTFRNAYSSLRAVTGKVYWEVVKDNSNCRTDDQTGGGASRALSLGSTVPGRAAQTFGLESPANVYVDNALVAGNPFGSPNWSRALFAFDAATGEVWCGNDNGGTQEWANNLVPGVDAGFSTTVTDLVVVLGFRNESQAMRVVSGTGCRYNPPTGFGYLESP